MRFRSYVPVALAFFLFAGSLFGQQSPKRVKPLVCGTSPAREAQERFLSRRASDRRTELLRVGRHATTASGTVLNLERAATAIAGDIFLMSTGAGVSLSRNPFPDTLLNRSIEFSPVDASASSYRVANVDGVFRDDAIGGNAVNLIRPGQADTIFDDDFRELPLPFPFSFYGATYSKVFVNANGHLSFEEPNESGFDLAYSDFLSGPPKIMGAGNDLDPEFSPSDAGLFVFQNETEFIVSYVRLSEFDFSGNLLDNLHDFQIRLGADGKISILHRLRPMGLFVMGISPGRNKGAGDLISFVQPPTGENSSSIAEIFSDLTSGEIDISRASQVFFETQPDDYDYIVLYNNLEISAGPNAVAFMLPVRNSVTGIGDEPVDRGAAFGSAKRMQALLQMGPLSQYPNSPIGLVEDRVNSEDTPLTVLAHEAGHRFLAFTLLQEGANETFNLLGRADAHWSFNFNSHGSFLEGNEILDKPDAPFTTGGPNQRYSELDRYLMGLVGPEQVGVEHRLFYIGDADQSKNQAPRRGVEIKAGTRRDFSINDIIAANGPRIPDHTVAQKRYRFAFILITADGVVKPEIQADLDKLNAFRTEFETFFNERTGGLAIADTSLKPGLNTNVFPAGGFARGSAGELTILRQKATDAAVPLTIAVSGDAAQLPASAEIPANATSVTIPVNAPNAGVSAVTVTANDNAYLPAAFHLAVSDAAQLSLELVSGTRYEAAPGATVAAPIVIRVRDKNLVPYQGVQVEFEATSGGSASPAVAITDANGDARFTWTVGNTAQNSAKIFLAGSRATSEVVITAVENLRPKTFAATNGASFAEGVSPGSLASLFGVSLAGGVTATATSLPLPFELEGVSVRVNGTPANLLFVSDLQINFYVPVNLNGAVATITVTTPDGTSDSFDAALNVADPAIFFDSGSNLGAVLPANSGLKTNVLPATPGGFVEIYCTGLGPIIPGGRGEPAKTEKTVTATLNGAEIEVVFSGLAPGFVGLYQVNAKLPVGLAPGTYVLRLHVEGKQSNAVNVIVGAAP